MKKLWNFVLAMSRATLFALLAVALVIGIMGFRLGSLTPGLSEPELATYQSADRPSDIIDNSVNAPYKTAVYVSTRIFDSAFGLRLVGAAVGGLSIVLFFLLVRKLFSPMGAIATTTMFATSSLLLHTSRLATGEVMLLSLLALVAVGYFIRFDKRTEIGWLLASAVIGLSLYVPGMAFFILAAAIWQFRNVRRSFEQLKPVYIIVSSVILSIICAPLIINLIREPQLWKAFLGFPEQFASLGVMAKTALKAIASIFAISPEDPVRRLGHQPILDVFAIALIIYGIIALAKQYKLERFWTLGGIFILAILWIAVTGNLYGLVLILPFLYIVIGIGMHKLMNLWLDVFPRNPIARSVGGVLMLIAICLSVNFQLHRYFVAWPHNDETKQAFTVELPQ